MASIYLARLDYEQDGFAVAAIRAMRFLRAELGGDDSFAATRNAVHSLIDDPSTMVHVTDTDDAEKAALLVKQASEFHQGAAEFVIDPEDLTVEGAPAPEAEASDDYDEYTVAAFKAALILVANAQSPAAAYIEANMLAQATEDPLYEEVQRILIDTFQVTNAGGASQPLLT